MASVKQPLKFVPRFDFGESFYTIEHSSQGTELVERKVSNIICEQDKHGNINISYRAEGNNEIFYPNSVFGSFDEAMAQHVVRVNRKQILEGSN
jgi:hypothetical protein